MLSFLVVRVGGIGMMFMMVIVPLLIVWTTFLHGTPLQSAIAYTSMHLHASNEGNDLTWPFWRQLDAALPPLRDWISAPNLLLLVVLKLYIFAAKSFDVAVQFVTRKWW